jgi:hypothetical protein
MFKPNISPTLLDQMPLTVPVAKTLKSGEKVVVDPEATTERVMLWFYLLINLGGLFKVPTTYTEKYFGWWLAFFLPTTLYLALGPLLWYLRNRLVLKPAGGSDLANVLRIVGVCFRRGGFRQLFRRDGDFFAAAKPSVIALSSHPIHVPWTDGFVEDVGQALTPNHIRTVLIVTLGQTCIPSNGNLLLLPYPIDQRQRVGRGGELSKHNADDEWGTERRDGQFQLPYYYSQHSSNELWILPLPSQAQNSLRPHRTNYYRFRYRHSWWPGKYFHEDYDLFGTVLTLHSCVRPLLCCNTMHIKLPHVENMDRVNLVSTQRKTLRRPQFQSGGWPFPMHLADSLRSSSTYLRIASLTHVLQRICVVWYRHLIFSLLP